MKQNKFLILSPGFPADEKDTSCLPAIQQFVLCAKRTHPGLRFEIISFQYPFSAGEYKWNGVNVVALGGKNRPGIHRLLTWLKAWRKLRQAGREAEVSGMLSLWLTECAFVGKWFGRFYGIRHLMWIQGQDARKENQFIRRIRPVPEEVIAISHFTSEEFRRNFGIVPFLIAQNGINKEIFPPHNKGERNIDILGAGSLIPLKRYDIFLDIISRLKKVHPLLRVVIAGGGIQEKELSELSQHFSLGDTVIFCGAVPHEKVLSLMSESKIFLHTSDYEGNSTVLAEALYSGCKVFSTRELTPARLENFYGFTDLNDAVTKISDAIRDRSGSRRVLFNDMESTARLILSQYPH